MWLKEPIDSATDADDGKTYSASLELQSNTRARGGCVLSVLCKAQTWTRAN